MEQSTAPEPTYHIPALLPQALEGLDIKPSGVYVDCTLGGGGHTRAILRLLDARAGGRLLSFDQDCEAIARAESDAELSGNSAFTAVHGNFRYLRNFLRYYGADSVDGILADLGVSFHHFDDPGRGFSFRADGPLDMRMNRDARLTAAYIVNSRSEEQLADIFYLLGELKSSRRLASAIVKARGAAPIATTQRLLEVIGPCVNPRQEKKELAQIFQALRIEVNGELDALQSLLQASLSLLKPGGRLAIITYHSLEDRLVKNFMRTGNLEGKAEKDFFGRSLSPLRPLTSKAVTPDADEVERNPRSRSAKLRVAERL